MAIDLCVKRSGNMLNQEELSKNTQDFINYSLIFNELEEKQGEKPQKDG